MSRPLDKEYVRLLHDVQEEQIPGHIYRGYTIITKKPQDNYTNHFQVNYNNIFIFFFYISPMYIYLVLFWRISSYVFCFFWYGFSMDWNGYIIDEVTYFQ